MAELRHVDPHKKRGPLYRAFVKFNGTRVAAFLSRHIVWKLDPIVMRLTGGRLGLGMMLPTALLETRGAKTGEPRSNGVIYFHDGDSVIVIASKLGAPEHPAWFYNVRAHPDDVVLGGVPFHAELVEDDAERDRIWSLADRVFPVFAIYRQRASQTGRTIPIFRFQPRG